MWGEGSSASERKGDNMSSFILVCLRIKNAFTKNSRILNETITRHKEEKLVFLQWKRLKKKNHSLTNSCYILCWCAKWGACAHRYPRYESSSRHQSSRSHCRCMHIYLLKVTKMLCVIQSSKACTSHTQRRSLTITHASQWPTKGSRKRQHMNEMPQTHTLTLIHSLNAHAWLARLEATCVYTLYYRTFTQV